MAYRKMNAASPMTALANAWFLEATSDIPSFRSGENVFSYRAPGRRTGHLFQFWTQGHSDRGSQIRNILAASAESFVVVTDIKNFYPSIDKNRVRAKVESAIAASQLSRADQSAAANIANGFFALKGEGIAIGPALSHTFANVCLAPLDDTLARKFGPRYMRYVDDIWIVVPRSATQSTVETINGELHDLGLEMKPEKTSVVSGARWLAGEYRSDRIEWAKEFSSLLSEITLYLHIYPTAYADLVAALAGGGFSIPVYRLKATSAYTRAISYIASMTRRGPRPTIKSIVERASRVRALAISHLVKFSPKSGQETEMEHRWQGQSLRHLVGALCLLGLDDPTAAHVRDLSEALDHKEFGCIVQALRSGDPTGILPLSGGAISLFSQVLRAKNQKCEPFAHKVENLGVYRDSLCTLAAFGLIDRSVFEGSVFEGEGGGDAVRILDACIGNPRRGEVTLDYLGEIEALGLSRDEIDEYLETRFDDEGHASVTLPGLASIWGDQDDLYGYYSDNRDLS